MSHNNKENKLISFEKLSEKLSNIGMKSDKLAADLTDIYESNETVSKFIETVYESVNNKDELEVVLIKLETEIEHIIWHYKSLKKILKD